LIWLNLNSALSPFDPFDAFLDVLQLDATGKRPLSPNNPEYNTVFAPSVMIEINQVVLQQNIQKDIYKNFVTYLTSPSRITTDLGAPPYVLGEVGGDGYQHVVNYRTGQNFWLLPVDFRRDLTEAADRLDVLVNEIRSRTGASKVDLVAHSQGGLVIRDYIADSRHTDRPQKVDKYVTLGTPYLGVPTAFRGLRYGWDFDIKIPYINTSVIDTGQAKKIIQNWTGVYQLLPANDPFFNLYRSGYFVSYRDIDFDGKPEDNLDSKRRMGTLLRVPSVLDNDGTLSNLKTTHYNSTLITLAEDFQERGIKGWSSPQARAVNRYVIAGVKTCTARTIYEYQQGNDVKAIIGFDNGDNLVPKISADMGNGKQGGVADNAIIYYAPDSPHGDLPNLFAKAIVAILLGRDPLLVQSNLSFTPSSATCTTIDLQSPANLSVEDAFGNRTGPKPNSSDNEMAIPGSQFFRFTNNQTTVIPNGGAYNILVEGTGVGTFDLRLRQWNDEAIRDTILFKDVPVTTQTKAHLVYTVGNVSPVLEVDNDGDGVIDVSVLPTSVLGASDQQSDFQPPVSKIKVEGKQKRNDVYVSDVTITLSAADNKEGSGVLRTSYSLDGGYTFNLYTSPIVITREGKTALLVKSSDRAGNTENPISVDITIDRSSAMATSTPRPTHAATPTRTPIPSRTPTLTPTPAVTVTPYPTAIAGLRALLGDLYQRGDVEEPIYRPLESLLRSAERQVERDHELLAIAEIKAFIRIVDEQSGKMISPHAAQQLIAKAREVIEELR